MPGMQEMYLLNETAEFSEKAIQALHTQQKKKTTNNFSFTWIWG